MTNTFSLGVGLFENVRAGGQGPPQQDGGRRRQGEVRVGETTTGKKTSPASEVSEIEALKSWPRLNPK